MRTIAANQMCARFDRVKKIVVCCRIRDCEKKIKTKISKPVQSGRHLLSQIQRRSA